MFCGNLHTIAAAIRYHQLRDFGDYGRYSDAFKRLCRALRVSQRAAYQKIIYHGTALLSDFIELAAIACRSKHNMPGIAFLFFYYSDIKSNCLPLIIIGGRLISIAIYLFASSRRTTACAHTPLPSPVKPIPSSVVALMLIFSTPI